jgi:hypothetical protein
MANGRVEKEGESIKSDALATYLLIAYSSRGGLEGAKPPRTPTKKCLTNAQRRLLMPKWAMARIIDVSWGSLLVARIAHDDEMSRSTLCSII